MDTLNEIRDAVVKTVNTVGKTVNNLEISTNNSQYFEFNTKLEDIKKMLDGDSDKDKMDSMKRLIAMISKGRDVSAIFPAVVKNVISKNIELKKLVYMYLTHYAEMEPDSSLLAINSFQKDLANSNQYIRASALRVMSSIRVKIISQIIVISIQKAVKDPSPYVRKTSAHAISKVFGLDIEHKDELIECIRILLQDRLVMVLGSAVAAWNEVCPERYDLIHPHYRKLCHLLADTDEWGQIMTLNMLTKYARIHFEDPNKERQQKEKKPKKEKKIFDNDDDEDEESDESDTTDDDDEDVYQTLVDPDLKLLLTNALPLLKNRNTGVVLSVATLYFYCAPLEDVQKVIKAVVRCAKGKREVEYIVLANIATMAQTRPALFEPYLTEFFVKPSDAAFVRNLKLEIVTLLVNSENINKILKEFKSYVTREEKDFVVATIQAIGRCASSVPEVTDRCLFGLMSLLSNTSDVVVAESVVVIKKLLQMLTDTAEHETTMKDVITQLVRILDTITSPSARASILWVIGEYCHKVPLLAPDVLRKLAKTFTNEDAAVKLQTLNLGAKLYLTNPDQTTQIFEYVINLARYDMNYDIRDKCRILRALLFAENPQLKDQAKKLLLTKKPIPTQVAPSEGRKRFMLGTLSHVLSHTAYGYAPLSDFPEKAPDKKVRDEVILEAPKADTSIFWSDSEEESFSGTETGSEEEGSQSESEEEEEESGSEEEEEESEEEESEEESSEEEVVPPPRKAPAKKVSTPPSKQPVKSTSQPTKPQKDSLDDLFNFGTPAPAPQSTPPSQAKKGQKPASQPQQNLLDDIFSSNNNSAKSNQTQTSNQPKYTLLKPHLGGGLGIEFSYVRAPSMMGNTIKTLVFYIKNQSTKTIQNIRIGKMALSEGSELIPFPEISSLGAGEAVETNLSVRFHSVTQPLKFAIASDQGEYNVSITPLIGELVRAAPISVDEFKQQQKKLKGLSEASDTVSLNDADEVRNLPQKIQEAAYLAMVDSDFDEGRFWFGGKTMIEDAVLLVAAEMVKDSTKVKLSVTSESTVLNSVLLQHLKKALLTQS